MDDSGAVMNDQCEVSVSLPDTSIKSSNARFVTYRRSFNSPTGLTGGDSVSLQSGLLPIAASIHFNGSLIDIPSEPSLEIGRLLLPHNELVVRIAADRFPDASQASASLEIIHAQ
jgi:hypothetical protein